MDKFHTEPKGWEDLFEYKNFIEVESKINKLVSEFTKEK